MIKIVCFFFSLFYLLSANAAPLALENLIAHAGGGLDGQPYLNCLECVENSLKHNMKYIELDLIKTTDGHIVAAHDWKKFHQITNQPAKKGPLTLDEFKQQKILNTYTPLTVEDIQSLMLKHKDFILIVDKLNDYDLLAKELPFPDRIMIEVTSFKNYHNAILAGFHQLICLIPLSQSTDDFSLYQELKKQNARFVSVHERFYKKNKDFLAFLRKKGIKVILFAPNLINNPENLSDEVGVYFDFVYSDF